MQVLKGEELQAADAAVFGGASDPYVEVWYGTRKFKTKVKKNTLNPVWSNAEFKFYIPPNPVRTQPSERMHTNC